MYEVGVVEVVLAGMGGVGVGVSDIDGVKDVGSDGGGNVDGVSDDAAPEEAASKEGASRVVDRGQGKPAMDASRLFSMRMNMVIGVNTGKTNGCRDTRNTAV